MKTDLSKDISNNPDFLAYLEKKGKEKKEEKESRLDRVIAAWGKIFHLIFAISIGIIWFLLVKIDLIISILIILFCIALFLEPFKQGWKEEDWKKWGIGWFFFISIFILILILFFRSYVR